VDHRDDRFIANDSHEVCDQVAVPAAMLSIVLLAAFVAVVVYTADLVVNGVPLADPTFGVRIYPIDALPSGYAAWLSALIVSMVASLAALSSAIYGTVGAIRGVQIKTAPAVNIVIDLDIASSSASKRPWHPAELVSSATVRRVRRRVGAGPGLGRDVVTSWVRRSMLRGLVRSVSVRARL
jgi:hypothetical protein